MIRKLTFICCCFLSVTAYTQSTGWLTYETDICKLSYPVGWSEKELTEDYTKLGMKFMLISPLENNKDKFAENINLTTEQKKAPITLQQYTSSLNSILSSVVNKFKLKSLTTKTNSSGDYAVIEYTGVMNNVKIYWNQFVWIKGVDIYVLSCTSAQSSSKKYKPIFAKISESFVIK